jgi:hypothetical protein
LTRKPEIPSSHFRGTLSGVELLGQLCFDAGFMFRPWYVCRLALAFRVAAECDMLVFVLLLVRFSHQFNEAACFRLSRIAPRIINPGTRGDQSGHVKTKRVRRGQTGTTTRYSGRVWQSSLH